MTKSVPTKWQWLTKETGPKMINEALALFGTDEAVGGANNPVILGWAKELGLKEYNADSIPWCGLFIAYVAKKAGKTPVDAPLWALNWQKFGTKVKEAGLGDVLVFKRKTNTGWAGHVGLYVGETKDAYFVLGGNQSDTVCITKILKSRCVSVNRPIYSTQPSNVRKIVVKDDGSAVSTNEA